MDYSVLINSPLFKGMTTEEIDSVISAVMYTIRKYKAGTIISQSGETVKSYMMIIKGLIKGEMIDYAGRVIKIEDIPAPGALASAFLFGNRNKFPVNVITVTDTELLIIEKNEFLKLLIRNNTILINFLDMISNRSQFLSEKIKFLNFKTIRSKLAQYILQMAAGSKAKVRFEKTQNELADFFGVARPSVARALGEMESEGLILARGKEITILNRNGLSELTKD